MPMGNYRNNMTAMSTAKSGYIQRKIVKVCEDIQVQYDQTVRDATGKIYQFVYGDDNYDPIKTIRVGGTPSPLDVSRLADRLNTSFELGIDDDDDTEPEISSSLITPHKEIEKVKVSNEQQKLIDKIRNNYPSTIVDDDWSVQELRQRLQALNLETEDSDQDDDDLEHELEDEEDDEDDDDEDELENDEYSEEDITTEEQDSEDLLQDDEEENEDKENEDEFEDEDDVEEDDFDDGGDAISDNDFE